MTFKFFLSQSGTNKNIHLNLTDKQQNKAYTFRINLRISDDDWDKEKQRPTNIYLKKYKKLNANLNNIKKELAERIWEKRSEKKTSSPTGIGKENQGSLQWKIYQFTRKFSAVLYEMVH